MEVPAGGNKRKAAGRKTATSKKKSQPRKRTSRAEKRATRDPRLVAIGERIKRVRLERSLEQKELAQLVDVTEKSVSNWELGENSPHRHIGLLARALGVSEAWLWQGQSEPDHDEHLRIAERQLDELRGIREELKLIRAYGIDQMRNNHRLHEDIPT